MTEPAGTGAGATAVRSAQLLDVSNYQGRFDWAGAKASIPQLAGGIFRLTQGLGAAGTNSPDPDAQWNHDQLKRLGLHAGAYHFMDPALDGAEQGSYFTGEYRKLGMEATDSHWLDNETAKPGISAARTSEVAQAFMAERDRLAPYNPHGVYSFIDFIRHGYCDGLGQYALWLAYPAAAAPVPPPPWVKWTVWQWGQRDGTDADAFNGTAQDFDAWIASFAQRAPSMHVADGTTSLHQVVTANPEMTVHGAWWHTARNRPHGWGPLEREYLQAGNWDAPMKEGTEIWG